MPQHDKEVEVKMLLETELHILIILILLRRLKTHLWWIVPVIEVISVHDTHVVNTVSPSMPDITDDKVSLLIRVIRRPWWIFGRGFCRLGLYLSYGTTFIDEGVVMHVQGGKLFA